MRLVYDFRQADGSDRDLLGGKGAGLAEMTHLGLPVPPGFTITTEACRHYLETGELSEGLWREISDALVRLEVATGRQFGATTSAPLLLSVRSGAKFSMPGMMDTVLNLGMNDDVLASLVDWSGDARFAWDAYRRFIQTFAKVVLGVDGDAFEAVLTEARNAAGVADDGELTAADLERVTTRFRAVVADFGHRLPTDPAEQLRAAVTAVFESWNNRRAQSYRRLHGIPHDLGTAVNVQMMVFGDFGEDSGTGVCFTRDPGTGERTPYGDYLPNAQGEDVVAGVRNTLSLDELAERHPPQHRQLLGVMDLLERHYRDMCDIEFTIERENLWILQTRAGKRTAAAAVRIATAMVDEALIGREEAVLRVDPASLDQLLHPQLPPDAGVTPVGSGVAASPGAATGVAVFDSDRAVEVAADGTSVILVRWETTPDDIDGMAAAAGILTSHGGKTSHAAVVARGMGRPAVTGLGAMDVDAAAGRATIYGHGFVEGDLITIDGTTGSLFLGEVELVDPEPMPEMLTLLAWADDFRRLEVRANADTPQDARRAREWGAAGIGLARTEHMFLGERLPTVRRLIMGTDVERKAALDELAAMQIADFEAILEAMDCLPVIVRLLDPPLHEFLPDRIELEHARVEAEDEAERRRLDELIGTVERLAEVNPMLGLRGVRLGLLIPDLYRMQVRAAVAAVASRKEAGGDPRLEIMIPLVSIPEELHRMRLMVEEELRALPEGTTVPIGTMIETPRAAMVAGHLAADAEFFSFGTNDLTQMTYGFSRDDAEAKFLLDYLQDEVIGVSPFESLDTVGVGGLIDMACSAGKAARPDLEAGLCGEHGGDPASIVFCHHAGLDYVSCSPLRIPVARLAAAHAAIGAASVSSTA